LIPSLINGELSIIGRLVDASNATLLCELTTDDDQPFKVIYKPGAGERPLWDFPEGNLAGREVAAFQLSEDLGLSVIPETVLREGPFGLGSVQRWIEIDESIDLSTLASSTSPEIRDIAFLDILLNNTDRKFGHLLPLEDGRILGCDHGLTFHTEDKLRTVLWQFTNQPITPQEEKSLRTLGETLDPERYIGLISEEEFAALLMRAERLLNTGLFPMPSEDWPAVPWPPF
jgi:hypothetical protein